MLLEVSFPADLRCRFCPENLKLDPDDPEFSPVL